MRKTQEDNEFRFQQLEKKSGARRLTERLLARNPTRSGRRGRFRSVCSAAPRPQPRQMSPHGRAAAAASAQIGEDSVGDTAGIPVAGQSAPRSQSYH